MRGRVTVRFLVLLAVVTLLITCAPTGTVVVETEEVEEAPIVTEEAEETAVVTTVVPTEEPAEPMHLVLPAAGGSQDELSRYLYDQCGVTYELFGNDYWGRMRLRFIAGGFDVLETDTIHLPLHLYADWGALAPVDRSTESALDEFIEPLAQAFLNEGTAYAVPTGFDTLVLFYNRDLFAKAKLQDPSDDWTWNELAEVALEITKSTDAYGFAVPADAYLFYPFVLQAGGRIMSPDFTETWIDSGEAIEAGRFYTSAREEGWAIVPEDVGASWQAEAFGWGEVAMVLGGNSVRSYLAEQFPGLAYGAVQAPAGPRGEEGTTFYATAYAVSAKSLDPQAAWEAIACLTSEEAQSLLLESGAALPSREVFKNHPAVMNDPVTNALFSSFWYASPYEWGPHHDKVATAVSEALRRVYYEGWAVEDSFKAAAEEIRAIIEQ